VLKLTKKATMTYGDEASRRAFHREVCSAKDVADAYGIPPEALAKILQRLAKAGLLQSQHGTNGGYTLARPAHTISAFEVIQAIDGPLFITSCVTVRGECDPERPLQYSRAVAQGKRQHRGGAEADQDFAHAGRGGRRAPTGSKTAELVTIG